MDMTRRTGEEKRSTMKVLKGMKHGAECRETEPCELGRFW